MEVLAAPVAGSRVCDMPPPELGLEAPQQRVAAATSKYEGSVT